MNVTSALLTLSQIAATFAGFTALMSLVRTDAKNSDILRATFRIMTMIVLSMITLFLCLLPIFLLQLNLSEQAVWITADLFLVVVTFSGTVAAAMVLRKMSIHKKTQVNRLVMVVNFGVSGTVMALVPIAFMYPSIITFEAAYLFGCMAHLFVAAIVFLLLVLSLRPAPADGG